jgi:hypothetical protein
MRIFKVALICLCLVLVPLFTFAQEHEEVHFDSEEEYVAEILTLDLEIQHLIKEEKLLGIHKPAFKAKDIAEALVEKKGDHHNDKLDSAVKRIGQAAKLLDKFGDAKDLKKTKAAYKEFQKAVADIKALYPKTVPSHYLIEKKSAHEDEKHEGKHEGEKDKEKKEHGHDE